METEAQTYLKQVRKTTNATNKRGKLIEKATRYLTWKERKNREDEKSSIDGWLNQPPWMLKDMPGNIRGQLLNRRNDLDEQLAEYSPPMNIDGASKDALYKRLKELNDIIQPCLLAGEVMRRNPAGAVDAYNKGENSPRIKKLIIERKNILTALEPDNDEKDYRSIELLRPAGITPDMAATFMMNAQIPGNFAMTALAKANWPAGMPEHGTVDTPMKQAERNELIVEMVKDKVIEPSEIEDMKAVLKQLQDSNAELRAALEAKDSGKAKVKEKRIAAMAKAREARAAKKQRALLEKNV